MFEPDERMKRIRDRVKPYMKNGKLMDDAPDDIKAEYKEYYEYVESLLDGLM